MAEVQQRQRCFARAGVANEPDQKFRLQVHLAQHFTQWRKVNQAPQHKCYPKRSHFQQLETGLHRFFGIMRICGKRIVLQPVIQFYLYVGKAQSSPCMKVPPFSVDPNPTKVSEDSLTRGSRRRRLDGVTDGILDLIAWKDVRLRSPQG
ncbi:hypothetical protein D3C75_641520 [compost metagenome]